MTESDGRRVGVGGAPKVRHRYIEGGRTSEVHFYSDIINERPLRKKPNINIPSPPPKRGFHTPTPPLKFSNRHTSTPFMYFNSPPLTLPIDYIITLLPFSPLSLVVFFAPLKKSIFEF